MERANYVTLYSNHGSGDCLRQMKALVPGDVCAEIEERRKGFDKRGLVCGATNVVAAFCAYAVKGAKVKAPSECRVCVATKQMCVGWDRCNGPDQDGS